MTGKIKSLTLNMLKAFKFGKTEDKENGIVITKNPKEDELDFMLANESIISWDYYSFEIKEASCVDQNIKPRLNLLKQKIGESVDEMSSIDLVYGESVSENSLINYQKLSSEEFDLLRQDRKNGTHVLYDNTMEKFNEFCIDKADNKENLITLALIDYMSKCTTDDVHNLIDYFVERKRYK